jgi:Chloroplast import apparatus Tic20-like
MGSYGSVSIAERFFGSLAYLLAIVRAFPFGMFLFQQFPIVEELYLPLQPLLDLYSGFGGFFLFLLLYFGVVNNPQVSRFIRFNLLQSILIGILLSLCGLLLQFLLPIFGMGAIIQVLMSTVFLGTLAMSGYGIFMSAVGKYTEIPQLSESAQIQVDRY